MPVNRVPETIVSALVRSVKSKARGSRSGTDSAGQPLTFFCETAELSGLAPPGGLLNSQSTNLAL
jgi:hypothetical protein